MPASRSGCEGYKMLLIEEPLPNEIIKTKNELL
jgi:hypothetical protein